MQKKQEAIIKIKATNMELMGPIENYVRGKVRLLQKFLHHYADGGGKLVFEVEVGRTTRHHEKGDVFRAEFNFNTGRAHFRSEAERDDLYAAIDEAKDEMQRELRKRKDKDIAFKKKGGGIIKKFSRGS